MSVEDRIDQSDADMRQLVISKSAAQRQLNAIRDPVAHLPFELSSEIFLHCLPQRRKPEPSTAPMLLLSICNNWTDIALSISISRTPTSWKRGFLHGRTCPLSLHLHIPKPGPWCRHCP
ncbi:hypothetical protein C8R47DRAFT_187658 [Mycena vitilis]|nr:hypothetical protein C8R47DRAFT_187658 [Mycena vitilis]